MPKKRLAPALQTTQATENQCDYQPEKGEFRHIETGGPIAP
jgi:hypothetical protein